MRDLWVVNYWSRKIWGEAFCREVSAVLCDEDHSCRQQVHFVTLVDISCATDVTGPEVDPTFLKRRLRAGLTGLNYIGVIEPSYYTNLQAGVRFNGKRCIFWHQHALVWGTPEKKLRKLISSLEKAGRYRSIAPGLRATDVRRIKPSELPETVGYMLKAPANAYRVSLVDRTDKLGRTLINENGEVLQGFKQGKSQLRPGERVNLFRAMRHLFLDDLIVAGGNGVALAARIKRIARPGSVRPQLVKKRRLKRSAGSYQKKIVNSR
jgi:hypothetical protein